MKFTGKDGRERCGGEKSEILGTPDTGGWGGGLRAAAAGAHQLLQGQGGRGSTTRTQTTTWSTGAVKLGRGEPGEEEEPGSWLDKKKEWARQQG
jgi:hypothetical protein